MNRLTKLLFTWALTAAQSAGQGAEPLAALHPLPPDMQGQVGRGAADRVYLSEENQPAEAWIDVRYCNAAPWWEVSLEYNLVQADGTYVKAIDVQSVPFQPTAACSRGGATNRLFVAGWYERGGQAVIEEWTIAVPLAVTSLMHPDGTTPVSLDVPAVTKRLVWSAQGAQPIRDLVSHPFAQRLFLLIGSAPRRIVSLDPATGALNELASSQQTGLECLSDHRALGARLSPLHGLVVSSAPTPDGPSPAGAGLPDLMLVLIDQDTDGEPETVSVVESAQFHQSYAAPGWSLRYVAP